MVFLPRNRELGRSIEQHAVIGVDHLEEGFDAPVEVFLPAAVERIHVIIPGDAAGLNVPIPGSRSRTFERSRSRSSLAASAALLSPIAHEHAIKRIRQLPDLVVSVLDCASGIIGAI